MVFSVGSSAESLVALCTPELQVLEMLDPVVVLQFVQGGVAPVALGAGELFVVDALDVDRYGHYQVSK